MKTESFLNTLLGRLLLFGMVPSMLTIIALVTMSSINDYHQLRTAEERLLLQSATSVAELFDQRNARWNTVATNLALSQSQGLFGMRDKSTAYIKSVLETSPLLDGTYIVYEPDADGQDAASLKSATLPPNAIDAAGRFVPYWVNLNSVVTLRQRTGMDVMESYQRPKNDFARTGAVNPVITEPVVRDGRLVVTHAFPIIINGKFAGASGVDRSLQRMHDINRELKERLGPDVFVISAQRRFIDATSDDATGTVKLSLTEVDKSPYAQLASKWRSEGTSIVFEALDPVLGVDCFYAIAHVATGDWKVVLRRTHSDVMATAQFALYKNIGIGAIAVIIVSALMFFIARSVSSRVRVAAEVAERIAHGDLTKPITDNGGSDETGQLIRSMASMDNNLNALVGSVKQSGIRLNSTATEIAATSRQQEMASSTFGAASNQIAAAVNEISATAKDLVRTMESVSLNASQTTELAGSGRAGLQAMESVMHDLDRATTSISDKLGAINERSQKITTVITTITKVADQTNILSINAAIEAEKAGEFGTGFLVIAREIRRLADQTASATLDIEQMVQQMQGAVSSGVMEMDRFSDQVRRGVKNVVAAGSQLTEIIDRINQSTESFKQINASMQAQSEGAEQISEAMGSLTANAQQTMQSAKEFGIASTDLQSAIATLREAVSKFKLKE